VTVGIELPAGAVAGDDFAFWDNEFRIVSTADHRISDIDVVAYATAVQLPDGTIATDARLEAPKVWLGPGGVDGTGLTSAQARELADTLVQLADLADHWAATA